MKKIIKIDGKEYTMQSSAYTQFKYKNDTGRNFLKDLTELAKLNNVTDIEKIAGLDDMIEMLLKIAYVMITEADSSQVGSYDQFLKSIEALYDDIEWITEVIELAVNPISRGIQKNSPSEAK